jgi:hypothetical protein
MEILVNFLIVHCLEVKGRHLFQGLRKHLKKVNTSLKIIKHDCLRSVRESKGELNSLLLLLLI